MDYKTIGTWVLGVLAVLGGLAFVGVRLGGSSSNFGAIQPVGSVETNVFWWVNGLFAGSTQQWSVDASGNQIANKLTASGLSTLNAGVLYAYPNATSTIGATETLAVSDVANYDTVILTPFAAGNTTLTLFASSTAASWLPVAGNHQRTCFINSTTTATATYTFAGGTGTTLLVASSSASALGSKVIGAQKMGCFDFVRAPASASTFDILGAFTTFL